MEVRIIELKKEEIGAIQVQISDLLKDVEFFDFKFTTIGGVEFLFLTYHPISDSSIPDFEIGGRDEMAR